MTKKPDIQSVIIAICTYKRPQKLQRLMNNLCEISYPKETTTKILIVDNDFEQSAKEIYEKFKEVLDIEYVCEPDLGLSNVRNKALKEALKLNATHLAFIDDDEIAEKDWLLKHIEFYNSFEKIYISSGPTLKKFEIDIPKHISDNNVFKVSFRKENGTIKKTCASGNVFFPLAIIEESGIYFDENFNFSGSEDTDFFGKLSLAGYPIGWNNSAINYEIEGIERLNINWILKRAFHNGYSVSMTKFLNKKFTVKRFFYILKKILTVGINMLTTVITIPFGKTKCLNMFTKTAKNSGKLIGAINPKRKVYYGKISA